MELKHCPFCGRKPKLSHGAVKPLSADEAADFGLEWKVSCWNCGIEQTGGITWYRINVDEGLEIMGTKRTSARTNAIEKWNRRSTKNEA